MKALSLSQPWASLVADGFKTIENRNQERSFRTPFPQRIVIHAAKSYDAAAPLQVMRIATRAAVAGLTTRMHFQYNQANVPSGALIAVCDFIDAGHPRDIANKYPDDAHWIDLDAAWCYVVRNAVNLLHPIPYRGQLGFFDVPDELTVQA